MGVPYNSKLCGGDFELGLAQLKAIAEAPGS